MEITIIGWYGTETIGDRAILAGIIHIVSKISSSFSIRLGSLYPFYSERTLMEDLDFYKEISSQILKSISIFDSRNPFELERNIKNASILVVGGGPLMDLQEMNMLEYAFFYAKKKKIKTALFGCGWGPLKHEHIRQKAGRLVELSDVVVFRDEVSRKQCLTYCPTVQDKVKASIDPALFTCHYYVQNKGTIRSEDYIAVNFRDVSVEGKNYADEKISIQFFCDIIRNIASQTGLPIKLIAMHNFAIGGDDRAFLDKIEKIVNLPNVRAVQLPLSLTQTMDEYYHARLCVGMRFHSIVLQTMLNGNNYIVDYTDPKKGKIVGLMEQLNMHNFYDSRYVSLYNEGASFHIDISEKIRYQYNASMINSQLKHYVDEISSLFK